MTLLVLGVSLAILTIFVLALGAVVGELSSRVTQLECKDPYHYPKGKY